MGLRKPQEAPGGPRQSPTGLGLRTDLAHFLVGLNHDLVVDIPTGSQDASDLSNCNAQFEQGYLCLSKMSHDLTICCVLLSGLSTIQLMGTYLSIIF